MCCVWVYAYLCKSACVSLSVCLYSLFLFSACVVFVWACVCVSVFVCLCALCINLGVYSMFLFVCMSFCSMCVCMWDFLCHVLSQYLICLHMILLRCRQGSKAWAGRIRSGWSEQVQSCGSLQDFAETNVGLSLEWYLYFYGRMFHLFWKLFLLCCKFFSWKGFWFWVNVLVRGVLVDIGWPVLKMSG